MDLHGRHVKLIGLYSLRHAIRGGTGLVFLLAGVVFSLFVASLVITPVETLMREQGKLGFQADAAEIVDQLATVGRPAVTWVLGGGDGAWADYLLFERPALLSAIFLILLFGLPFLIPLGAFNQTAGDVGSRGIRYLLLRTERDNIFFGRFLATSLFAAVVFGLSIATIALYVGLKLDIYGAWEIASFSLHGLFAVVVLSLPYVALCAWISAANDSPLLSLVVCTLVVGGVLVVALIAGHYWEPAKYLKWLLPWGVQNRLFSPTLAGTALAAGACLAYTAAFLYLGHRHFSRRDL